MRGTPTPLARRRRPAHRWPRHPRPHRPPRDPLNQRDPRLDAPLLDDIDTQLAGIERKPAVVLFHYDSPSPGSYAIPFHSSRADNIDTARPDDAAIVRAHDLGPAENHRIFDYYAKTTPPRYVYLYDRSTAELKFLGRASDLAVHPPEGPR